ncbi:gallate dioxygenase [Hyphococcus luteus]|uniref:Protocatechuate 3,4-dioxygenase n=1 Tax=Hyphococcus luteus TaxID=2058213 RepID=A0A2S7K4A2_9PROT|nr:gallate dioxygenase [Marinicaulis flavus]PQA87268.1 protocatechuate 3,4-dioxygenase [Marinicaulis flavus]
MAKIVGGIATSHTPTISFALDAKKHDDPVWAPIFKGYEPVQDWLAEKKPDVLFYIFNDHMTSFFIDQYPHFALGVGDEFPPADEGGGPRGIPAIKGDPKLAEHIANGLVADEFDISTFQNKGLDHGCFSPLSLLLPDHKDGWPLKLIPFQIGVLQFPAPTMRRCYKIGRAIRRAIQHYPEDIKVAIAGTGGLSHQVHGERCGFNNTEWDMEFMERLEKDPEGLLDMTHAELAELGGLEGAEIVMWMIMRGALSKDVETTHKAYYLPSMCAIANMVLEERSEDKPEESDEAYLARIHRQTAGVEKLDGTYPFTIGRGVQAFRLNNFLHSLVDPEHRKLFLEDEEASFEKAGLTEEERRLVRERDWQGLIHYGVIFFMLEKLGAVVGTSNLHIYAAMRGQTLEDFQKTRNAQIMYSVAGTDEGKTDWDKPAAE